MLKKTAGFSLLEGLLSVLILSIGLLGLAKLQASLWNTSSEIHNREMALIISQSTIEYDHSTWIVQPNIIPQSPSTRFNRSHKTVHLDNQILIQHTVSWSDRGDHYTIDMRSIRSDQNPKDTRWVLTPN